MKKNKVKFNLRNAHWGLLDFDDSDQPIWGAPYAWPGSVSLTMDPQGDVTPFYADGIVYWRSAANNGYEGDYETALIPEEFRELVLKEKRDANGVFIETSIDANEQHFYLMYEVEGDQHARRCILYNCTATRPGIGGSTTEDTKEPETDSITITATPLPDSMQIKAMTSSATNQAVYDAWYSEPYYNAQVMPSVDLTALSLGAAALVPDFEPGITLYAATTSAATNTITATAVEGATVGIMANGDTIANGASIAWAEGDNNVTVRVSSGDTAKAYTIIVTKE